MEVELKGRRAPAFAAIVEKGEVCIGVEVLERLGLAVDPASGRIYPTRRFVTRLYPMLDGEGSFILVGTENTFSLEAIGSKLSLFP